MKTISTRQFALAFAAVSCICILAASSASAVVVTWNLNPQGLEQAVGSSNQTFTVSGYSITAYGYTIASSGDTPLGLYYKNQGSDEVGLGIVGPSDHELQSSGGTPLQYIQLDLGALFASGKLITDGKIEVGSVQSGEAFSLYGSSTLGSLGTKIGSFGSSSDDVFVDIPNFGAYRYISVGATSADVLPVAFQANCSPIPEMSALFPIVGLIAAVSFTQLLRRRRMAQLRTGSASA